MGRYAMKTFDRQTLSGLNRLNHANVGQISFIQLTPPASLLPWLMATGSLTAQLEAVLGQKLQIRQVHEGFKLMNLPDLQLLTQHSF